MSHKVATIRLRPHPDEVFLFADTSAELRYRLVLNYVNADAEAGEPQVPPVVRKVFNLLLHITNSINDSRPEDQKLEGHVMAARELVDRFERDWTSDDHRIRAANRQNDLAKVNELTEYDWASIRRNPPSDANVLSTTYIDAQFLDSSPFRADTWTDYEAAVEQFVITFDPACITLYRLGRALAEVRYPDPAILDATHGTPVHYDEHLIKFVNPQVRELLYQFQKETGFKLNVGDWFDAADPHSAITGLYESVRKILGGWCGEVTLPPELDRPRWQPAEAGSKNQGVLSFRGQLATVSNQASVIVTVIQAFEDESWTTSVLFPLAKLRRVVLQSLNTWAKKQNFPMKFSPQKQGKHHYCQWHPTNGGE